MHPNNAQIEGYAKRTLSPAELLEVDDHVAACDACRSRAAALAGIAESLESVQGSLLPPESHLSDAQVGEYLARGLNPSERESVEVHLRACAVCAREVNELGAWARKRPTARLTLYAAAAAVLILLMVPLALRWRSLLAREQGDPVALAGLETLPAEQQQNVQAALRARIAQPPAYLADLVGPSGVLMGEASGAHLRPIEPLGTVTVSDRPPFRWEPLTGAATYTVLVSDDALRPVAESPPISQTSWTPGQALTRGRVYVWQITAHRAEGVVRAPAPPLAMARFKVLEEESARLLERVAREHPDSHLLLGILYAQAGVTAEAIGHLQKIPRDDPHYETARRTLDWLRSSG